MKKINFSGGEPFLVQGGRFLGTVTLSPHTPELMLKRWVNSLL
jgi:hypothetical protein